MSSKNKNLPRIIFGALCAVVIALGILLYLEPPSVFPDPANGFLVMRSMEHGAPFNHLVIPDQEDLAKNTSEFLTWWSPGQYLVPYAIKLFMDVNTGQASAITITLCQLIGLWGLYVFFKKAGFSPLISALSILFIACQQFFVVPYVFYNGGEILFFAFSGWFLYALTVIEKPGWKLFVIVLLTGWVGFFCKSSMLWMYVAGLLYLWLRLSSHKSLPNWIKNGVWIAISAMISVGAIWLFYLSKGENPVSDIYGFKFTWKTLGFPLASPLLSGFSIDDLLHGLIYHTDTPLLPNTLSILLLILLAILSVWLVCVILERTSDPNYRLLIKVFYMVSVLFFGYVYLRKMPISYEARHFRIIGLIVIPGTIYRISKAKLTGRVLFTLAWTGIAVSSIIYAAKGYISNKDKSGHGTSGIAQQAIDQKSLDQILALDKQNTNAIFVFVNKGLALEIKHNRVITLEPIGDDLKIDLDDYEYDGHAGPLYIILPESYNGPREKMILKAFPDYKGWYGSMLSDGYVMYAAK
ncbi:MAG TPA: hypothetical protein VHE59_01205 [Mucilaginibacter sp.]|nr:hypothetical protein [Mucilaginibacter sp.]